MECHELTDDVLSELLSGELEGVSEAEIEEHLRRCDGCRRRFEWLSRVSSGARALVEELPAGVPDRDAVLAAVGAAEPRPAGRGSSRSRLPAARSRSRRAVSRWFVPAAAAAAAGVTLWLSLGWRDRSADRRIAGGRGRHAVSAPSAAKGSKAPPEAEGQVEDVETGGPGERGANLSGPEGPGAGGPVREGSGHGELAGGRVSEELAPTELESRQAEGEVRPPSDQKDRAGGSHLAYLDAATGAVEFVRAEGGAWAAQAGLALAPGDGLRTLFARSRVRFESGSVLHLNRFTSVKFLQPPRAEPTGVGSHGSPRLELIGGEIYVETSPADRGFAVETPHGLVRDLGTRFGVDAGVLGTTVCVVEGKAEVATDAGRAELGAGQEVVLARRTAQPGPVRDARGLDRRFAWTGEDLPPRREAARPVFLAEDFGDPQLVSARWWAIPGRFPSATLGRLEIDPSGAIRSGRPEWLGPGGIQSRAAFPLPLRVSLDVEMTHRHESLIAALLFMPQGVRADSEKGDVFRVELRADTYGLAVQASRYVAQREVAGQWPRRERWTVEVSGDDVRFLADGREVLRSAHGRKIYQAYHIRPECNATGNAPAEARVRFDNIVVEPFQGPAGGTR